MNGKIAYTGLALSIGLFLSTNLAADVRTPVDESNHIIRSAGSYYLTGDIETIAISAGDVTLDLNGYNVTGKEGISSCIDVNAPNATVHNGSVDGCFYGVRLNSQSHGSTVSDLRFKENNIAIWVRSTRDVVIRDSLFLQTEGNFAGYLGHAIHVEATSGVRILNNVILGSHYGVHFSQSTADVNMTRNIVAEAMAGVYGVGNIHARNNVFVSGARQNADIDLADRRGIAIEGGGRVESNLVEGYHSAGILLKEDSQVINNLVQGNGILYGMPGIEVGNNALIEGNAVRDSGGEGIRVAFQGVLFGDHALVMNNVSVNNSRHGPGFSNIRCGEHCLPKNNVDW